MHYAGAIAYPMLPSEFSFGWQRFQTRMSVMPSACNFNRRLLLQNDDDVVNRGNLELGCQSGWLSSLGCSTKSQDADRIAGARSAVQWRLGSR